MNELLAWPADFVVTPFVEFGFMRRALVGCLALALGGGPVGVFLLLRRMSLIGDALSHAVLPGAAIAQVISAEAIDDPPGGNAGNPRGRSRPVGAIHECGFSTPNWRIDSLPKCHRAGPMPARPCSPSGSG